MSRTLITIMLMFVVGICFGQQGFKPGYYIDQGGTRNEVLVKNEQWADNPTSFSYKTAAGAGANELSLNEVKEFGIGTEIRFIRAEVSIDRSPSKLMFLTGSKEPQFSGEILFLKVLIDGKAMLYSYKDGDLLKYFYSVDQGPVEQLIYKTYRVDQNNIAFNNSYKLQLLEVLTCESIDLKKVRTIEYKRKALLGIFTEFNACGGGTSKTLDKSSSGIGRVNIKLLAGYQFSQMNFVSNEFRVDFDYDNDSKPFFGFEAEVILPFKNGGWSLLLQPTLHRYKSSERTIQRTSSGVDYTGITLPIMVRRYFNINEQLDFYLNGGFSPSIPLSDTFSWGSRTDIVTDYLIPGFTVGGGLRINRLISIDIQHHINRNVLIKLTAFKASLSATQIGVSYKIFEGK